MVSAGRGEAGMRELRKDCFFYYGSQDMGATVPNCSYDMKYEYGFCPCSKSCENYIERTEAYELVKCFVQQRAMMNKEGSE